MRYDYIEALLHHNLTRAIFTSAQKGGFLGPAAEHGIAILFPDTSPRGAGIPGEDDEWDFGTGAGFYLDATNPIYSKHYNMYTHVTADLPHVIRDAGLPVVSVTSTVLPAIDECPVCRI